MTSVHPDLSPQQSAARLVEAHHDDPGWLDAFARALDQRRRGGELARVLSVWALSRTEAGRLFGVTRQAVAKWLDDGAPVARIEQIADLAAATDLLTGHLKRDRIPAVVRRPNPALGGRSLLDLLDAGDTRRLRDACREMFTFTDAHG